jgi:hypothetical protein
MAISNSSRNAWEPDIGTSATGTSVTMTTTVAGGLSAGILMAKVQTYTRCLYTVSSRSNRDSQFSKSLFGSAEIRKQIDEARKWRP